MCCYHAWWWPVLKAHTKQVGAGAASGQCSPQGPGHRGNTASSPQQRIHISFSKRVVRHQKQGRGFGAAPKGQAGQKGCREQAVLPRLPRAHPPWAAKDPPSTNPPQARDGLQRPRTHLLRFRQASGPLSPCPLPSHLPTHQTALSPLSHYHHHPCHSSMDSLLGPRAGRLWVCLEPFPRG